MRLIRAVVSLGVAQLHRLTRPRLAWGTSSFTLSYKTSMPVRGLASSHSIETKAAEENEHFLRVLVGIPALATVC